MVEEGWNTYQSFQQAYPLLNSMVTGSAIFTSADAISQLINEGQIDKRKIKHTAGLSPLYGLISHYLVEGGNFIGEGLYNHPLMKSLGTVTLGTVFNGFFFSNNNVGEKNDYRLKNLAENYSKILYDQSDSENIKNTYKRFKENFVDNVPTKEFRKCVAISLPYWMTVNSLNFTFTPEHMRTPAVMAASFVWTCLLSLWSLKGRKDINHPKNL